VFLCGDARNPNLAIGIRNTGEVVVTNDLNHAYWGHAPGNPRVVDLDIHGVGVAGVNNGVLYYTPNYNYGRWSQVPGIGGGITHVELYGVSASALNNVGEMYVTDDITKGQWRKIPFPTQNGPQGSLRYISMWSHSMIGVDSNFDLWVSSKPDLGKMIAELAAKVAQLTREKAALLAEIEQKKTRIAELEAQAVKDEALIAQLKNEVASLEQDLRNRDSEIATLNARVAALEAELAQANETIVDQKAIIDQKDGQILSLQNQRKQLQQQVATLSTKLGEANADIKALEAQLRQARAQITRLTQAINALVTEVRTLRQQLGQANQTIDILQDEQAALMAQYESKIQELLAARQTISNLESANSDQADAFAALEQDLLADIERVRADYAAASQNIKELQGRYEDLRTQCPIIPEGTVVLDGGTGQLYLYENKALRPMSTETWRDKGSPAYTTYQSYMLQNCTKGPAVIVVPTTAPSTTTPAPVRSAFDPTMYAIVHRDTYVESGKLHVLTAQFGSVSLTPYAQRNIAQIFLFSNEGRIRHAGGKGPYLEHSDGCLLPTLREEPSDEGIWTVTPTGEAYANALVSACGAALHANENSSAVDLARQIQGSAWFVVPVGSASI